MKARDQVFFEYTPVYSPERRERFRQQLDAIEAEARAEVRRGDAARLLAERAQHRSRDVFCRGIEYAADRLNQWAGEEATATAATATPGFFQPGHTYLHERLRWKFRCDAVTVHPDTGNRVAVGWSFFGHGKWQTGDMSDEIWAEGGWTDVTGAGGVR